MPDTSRGDYPDNLCCDCGQKGCEFRHWGPLVPDGRRHNFCASCYLSRREHFYTNNHVAKPLPDNHVCGGVVA